MQLSVIIVNYNVQYFLEQALLSVQKASKGLDMEVFVVDNNSVDDSVQMVQEKFPEVHLLANKDNPGFSKANNQAIRLAKGKYVLLLNPDTVVEEDTFTKCFAFMEAHPDAGALGVKMIDGSGKFLPESKRGFPSPFVAFCKTFGLSSLFPKSRLFNQYHLGFLDKDETHEIDVLAGAFMWMRQSTLDKVGLLDETFFMYGEDIDLSYRIVKGGYKNYYFADTTIIHYKGESTKKGSLNYVRVFYNAMIIFAKKHFEGEQARLFVWMLQLAIYFRAFLTLLSNWSKRLLLPFLDAAMIIGGMYLLKESWEIYRFDEPDYYAPSFMRINVPLYTFIWITAIYFNGGYDVRNKLRHLVRGVFMGSLIIAAVYGFLNMEYRTSRMLIVFGTMWTAFAAIAIRTLLHIIKYKNFNIGNEKALNLVIVGTKEESQRVLGLIHQAQIQKNFIGTVSPPEVDNPTAYLSNLAQLDEVVQIYKVDEIIFCSKDISAQHIMQWMTRLGADLIYKIVPKESLSIIGSSSKNTAGELYTIDIQFQIATTGNRRNKRLFDLLTTFILWLILPISLVLIPSKWSFLKNSWAVFIGQKGWIGYVPIAEKAHNLPNLRPAVLSPIDALSVKQFNKATKQRLNFLYAKDYEISRDIEIFWKGFRNLGR